MLRKAHYATVLNTIQATAADVDLATGIITMTGLQDLPMKDLRNYTKRAYTAGVASVKTVNVGAGVSLVAGAEYTLEVRALGTGRVRKYYVFAEADTALTANQLAAALNTQIGLELAQNRIVTSSVSTSTLTLTLSDLADGDFDIALTERSAPQNPTLTTTTAYVAPAGTSTLVQQATGFATGTANGQVTGGAEYTTYEILMHEPKNHNEVQGANVGFNRRVLIALNENATNFAALETALDAILEGTATAADYNGIPTA
jgi:hypothetical protein